MTAEVTGSLIDDVARELRTLMSEDAADAVATSIVGQLQSRYLICPLPTAAEDAAARLDLAALEIPGLFITATKGQS